MSDIWIDIICFFTTFGVLVFAFPYIRQFTIKMVSHYIMMQRIKKAGTVELEFEGKEKTKNVRLGQEDTRYTDNFIITLMVRLDENFLENTKQLLQKAGKRDDKAVGDFMHSKIVSAVLVFFISFVLIATNETIVLDFWLNIPVSFGIAVLGGHRLTDLNMIAIAKKRKDAIEHGVPDLVDLLVICTESGLDLNRSLRRIAKEMRTSNSILADELGLMSIEMEMIPDQRQVFENFERRIDSQRIKSLAKSLSQSVEYGASLAVTLRDLAVESRQKRMLDAEARAAQIPTLMTLPMMFFILPCLLIVMIGPVIIDVIKAF
ncbi:MAG: type II secretion system F family protein [Holosporaceae bacterium]|jgi:tight adherence protein C|nr:type II secretion system F family protein [Holosporaceae bacterium]